MTDAMPTADDARNALADMRTKAAWREAILAEMETLVTSIERLQALGVSIRGDTEELRAIISKARTVHIDISKLEEVAQTALNIVADKPAGGA